MTRRGGRPPNVRQPGPESLLRPQPAWAADSLRATMAAYIEAMRVLHRSENSLRGQSYPLLAFARWCEDRGLASPRDVTTDIMERYQRHLFYVRKKDGQPLTANSQHKALVHVRLYFRWCARNRHVSANPASDLMLPKLGTRLPRHLLSIEDVELLLSQPRVSTALGLRDKAILEVMWATALRRSEVLRLRLHDVRASEGTVFVSKGKGNKDRIIPISARAVAWVQRYLEASRPRLWVPPETGFLFLSDAGFPLSADILTQKVRHYLNAAGIEAPGSCHLLRHASATALLEGGADVRYVQDFLGHASLEATQVYTHVTLTKLKAIYEACHPGARTPSTLTAAVSPNETTAAEVLQALEAEGDDEDSDSDE